MKKLLTILLFLLPGVGLSQTIGDVNIVRNGYWQVVSPDTITNHTAQYQAIERQINLLLQGIPENQITIKPPLFEVRATYRNVAPDTVYLPADTVYQEVGTDTVYAYQDRVLYATTIPDTNMRYYAEHEAVRNIDWQLIEDHPDSSNFRIRIIGKTTPETNSIRFASKCIGYDSTMTAIDDRVSMTLTPDSLGNVSGETRDYVCYPNGGNASMNYWLTARMDTTEIVVRKYIDVAHVRSIGN